jgi:hypothetical protein
MRLHGSREDAFIWTDSTSGIRGVGDGITPARPIATHGGDLTFLIDVDVPNIAAGVLVGADFSGTYPGLAVATQFPLLRYGDPASSTTKLHGKGTLLVHDIRVILGTTITGAAPLTGSANPMSIVIAKNPGLITVWSYQGAIPSPFLVTPTTNNLPAILGNDASFTDLVIEVINSDNSHVVTGGRLRVLLQAIEI